MSQNMWPEELMRLAIDDRTELIFVKDLRHRYLLVNAEFAATLNCRPDEMTGKPDTDFWPKAQCLGSPEKGWRGFHEDEKRAHAGETLYLTHEGVTMPDGTERFFDISYTPLNDEQGHVYGILGQWREVTNPREVFRTLKESERRLRTLIDASPDFIAFKDGKGAWQMANLAGLAMYELTDKPWRGKTDVELAEMLPPWLKESLLTCAKTDEAAWQAGSIKRSKEYISLENGDELMFDVTKTPLFDDDGKRKALVVIGRDMTAYVESENHLREGRAFMEGVLQGVNLPTFIIATDHTVLMWNRACEEMTGIQAADIVGSKEAWRGFYSSPRPCLADLMVDHRSNAVEGYYHSYAKAEYAEGAFRAEAWFTLKGKKRYLSFEATPIHDAQGKLVAAIETLYDITDHMAALDQLQLAATIYANSHEAIVITDADNFIVTVNRAFTDITGYGPEEVIGRNPRILSSGRHDKKFYQDMWQNIITKGFWQGEVWDRRKNGEIYPKWMGITTVRNSEGVLTNHVAMFSDLTERNASDSMVKFLTYYDPLTKLPNRVLLRDRCVQVLAAAERGAIMAALLVIDLDDFKRINDSLGHVVGDRLLQQVAERLKECVRETDTIGRLGGDEFVILLTDIPDVGAAERVAQKILARFEEPVVIDENKLGVTFSIGASLYPEDGEDFDTLLKKADAAMYSAKDGGRNAYRFFAGHMSDNVLEHLQMRNQLGQVVREGFSELKLHYQPQFDLESGRIVGVEALLRWNSPHLGAVSPANFIPVAEESGLIVPMGAWVIREACRQNREWQDAGHEPMVVAVNISALQFRRGSIVQTVADALRETGLAPQWLELELTESVLIHNVEHVLEVLRQLKEIGVKLSIDDFGTGYSSLSYLKRFKVDKLKIDQSFVRNLMTDEDDAAIVQSVIQLGISLRLKTIAEGVETAEQVKYLHRNGCNEVQGYYYSRPLPAEEMIGFLKTRVAAQ